MDSKVALGKWFYTTVDSLENLHESQKLGWQIQKFEIPKLWLQTKGKGVKVAIIDTAADLTHPDLLFKGGFDFVKNNPLNKYRPQIQHATHVAGIIGARDNKKGIVGVAPECELYSLAILEDNGTGSYENLIKALQWCIDNKIDVINMSFGGDSDSQNLYQMIRKVYDAGITMVCAAGNSAWEKGYLDFPAIYNETIAVASIKPDMTLSEFSSIGPNIDVCAPGSDILSCVPGNKYGIMSGTSMAAPFVTGVITLLIAKHRMIGGSTPINNPEDVREHIIKVAKDISYNGRDQLTGYGIISPLESMEYAKDIAALDFANLIRIDDPTTGKAYYKFTVQFGWDFNDIQYLKGNGLIRTLTTPVIKKDEIVEILLTEQDIVNIVKKSVMNWKSFKK